MSRILVIEDDDFMRLLISQTLRKSGFEVEASENGTEGLTKIEQFRPMILLLDFYLPDSDGLEMLRNIKLIDPTLLVIIMTARGNIHNAVESMKLGAYDYVEKSNDLNRLVLLIRRALQTIELTKEVKELRDQLTSNSSKESLIGESKAIQKIIHQIDLVANTNLSVYIEGETGTGKELIANLIHQKSHTSKKNFVAVDCGAIPETLFESEMFGHEKGSFTGAVSTRIGKFEEASGGTLFLDEISNFPVILQTKLLRAIQEKKITKLGGKGHIDVDTRLISASNRDLRDQIAQNKFKDDLYYRINEFNIHIPPLRERKEDIFPLSAFFLREANNEFSKHIDGFLNTSMNMLLDYPWPGNVRELRNTIRKAVLMTDTNMVHPEQLILRNELSIQKEPLEDGEVHDLTSATNEVKKRNILKALERTHGNKTEAAQTLGISRRQLYRELHRLGLDN